MASKKKTTKKAVKKTTKKSTKSVKKTSTKAKKKSAVKAPVLNSVSEVNSNLETSGVLAHSTKDNITPHDKFNSMIFIIGLLAVIVLLVVVSPIGNFNFSGSQNPASNEGTHLLMSFGSDNMNIGDTAILAIDANNFNDLVGYELSLGFNSDVLKFNSLEYGDFLGANQGKICVPHKNLGSTIDNIACIKLPSQPGNPQGVSGSGRIATLTFEVVGRGEVLLQAEDVKLLNSKKESIDYQVLAPKIVVR